MTTHTRIRKFNTKDTYPEQQLDNDLCQAVVARGSIVFVRGQIGQDLDTSASVAIGDPAGQIAAVGVVPDLVALAEDVQRVLALEHLLHQVGHHVGHGQPDVAGQHLDLAERPALADQLSAAQPECDHVSGARAAAPRFPGALAVASASSLNRSHDRASMSAPTSNRSTR